MALSVPQHTVDVAISSGLFVPSITNIRVGDRGPLVWMVFGRHEIPMRTPDAHRVGFALIRAADRCLAEGNDGLVCGPNRNPSDFVVLTVNQADIHLPAEAAKKLGTALLRRSDPADDYQLKHRMRTIT